MTSPAWTAWRSITYGRLRFPGQLRRPPRPWRSGLSCTNIQPGPLHGGRPAAPGQAHLEVRGRDGLSVGARRIAGRLDTVEPAVDEAAKTWNAFEGAKM